jgi:uncharacterized damage-inducible protein DinB
MNVESFERETTRVATLTLSNSVMRQLGISSVKRRSSAGEGFQTTDFAAAGGVFGNALALAPRFGSAGRVVADARISVISIAPRRKDCAGKYPKVSGGAIVHDYNARAMADLAKTTLQALQARICRVFPAQIRAAVEALDDDQIWWRPNETSNSIGNLVLHLSGSLNHYLNRGYGGLECTRDRDGEFAERRHVPRAELMATFDAMVANAEKTFERLTPERLTEPAAESKQYATVAEELISINSHIANHTGQIVWIAKALKDGALSEVWMHTHKRLGGWSAMP